MNFTFTDNGEPGSSDFAQIEIRDPQGNLVLFVAGNLHNGNQQAHPDNGRAMTQSAPATVASTSDSTLTAQGTATRLAQVDGDRVTLADLAATSTALTAQPMAVEVVAAPGTATRLALADGSSVTLADLAATSTALTAQPMAAEVVADGRKFRLQPGSLAATAVPVTARLTAATAPPAADSVRIDWAQSVKPDDNSIARSTSAPAAMVANWQDRFVNHLGASAERADPNASLRLRLDVSPRLHKAATEVTA